MKKNIYFFIVILLCLPACTTMSSSSLISVCEARNDTQACNDLSVSNYSASNSHSAFSGSEFNGFIVAIDKSKHAKLKFTEDETGRINKDIISANDQIFFDFSSVSDAPSERFQSRVEKTLHEQSENLFVSGVSVYGEITTQIFEMSGDCGKNMLDTPTTYIRCSSEALDMLQNRITETLRNPEENPYSHVLLHSTGWNNLPDRSRKHYVKLQDEFSIIRMNGLTDSEKSFNPLFVGLTWPSKWDVPFISLFNKKNDADELGLIWLNYLMNKTIPNAIIAADLDDSPKFIAAGHSLGARAMATAAFSKPYLVESSTKNQPSLDSLILLQPAFSASRFYIDPYKHNLGHFRYYDGIENNSPVTIVTSSKYDKAVKLARWVDDFKGHMGGGKPHKDICKRVENEISEGADIPKYWDNRFICRQQGDGSEDEWGELARKDGRVLFLRMDAGDKDKAFINKHTDVKNLHIAKLIMASTD